MKFLRPGDSVWVQGGMLGSKTFQDIVTEVSDDGEIVCTQRAQFPHYRIHVAPSKEELKAQLTGCSKCHHYAADHISYSKLRRCKAIVVVEPLEESYLCNCDYEEAQYEGGNALNPYTTIYTKWSDVRHFVKAPRRFFCYECYKAYFYENPRDKDRSGIDEKYGHLVDDPLAAYREHILNCPGLPTS